MCEDYLSYFLLVHHHQFQAGVSARVSVHVDVSLCVSMSHVNVSTTFRRQKVVILFNFKQD